MSITEAAPNQIDVFAERHVGEIPAYWRRLAQRGCVTLSVALSPAVSEVI